MRNFDVPATVPAIVNRISQEDYPDYLRHDLVHAMSATR